LGRQHLRALGRADIEKFQADVTQGKTKAPVTAKGAKKRGRIRVLGGAAVAARATAALRAMLNWAIEQKLGLKENPASKVRLNKLRHRERFLDDAELARLGKAVGELEAGGVNASSLTIARLLALTGARKNEIASLRWRYVDFQRSALILPDSKTGARLIPLGAPALAVLMAWGEHFDRMSGDQFVFPAERGDGFHEGVYKVWRRLRKMAGLSGEPSGVRSRSRRSRSDGEARSRCHEGRRRQQLQGRAPCAAKVKWKWRGLGLATEHPDRTGPAAPSPLRCTTAEVRSNACETQRTKAQPEMG
jgi:integrase